MPHAIYDKAKNIKTRKDTSFIITWTCKMSYRFILSKVIKRVYFFDKECVNYFYHQIYCIRFSAGTLSGPLI